MNRHLGLKVLGIAVVILATLCGSVSGASAPQTAEASDAAADAGGVITPAVAQALYDRVRVLHEADGCQLLRFDTGRRRISVGLQARSGAEHTLELAAAASDTGGRKVGRWALTMPAEIERDCGATLAAIERVLSTAASPQRRPGSGGRWDYLRGNYALLAATFVLLLLGTAHILAREARAQSASPYGVIALLLVWGAALALRLGLSPRTFLHEYYHIAETVPGYLTGAGAPAYGNTGPALFRLVGALLGRPDDVQVIFVSNAVLASLAIPAVALLDLVLMRSWPRALCAAVLLCVLPQHLRFSAAEDLFVQAVTFGLWALALFALYLRTRRAEDALVSALALSLAMQTRPEMLFFPAVLVALVLLTQPRSWGVLVSGRTLLALGVLGVLLIPRLADLRDALREASAPAPVLPSLWRYVADLELFHSPVTPVAYWVLLGVGLIWGLRRAPGVTVWVTLVFGGYSLFSLSVFNNPPYNLRSQILPTSFVVLVAAGAASVWMERWGTARRAALVLGTVGLTGLASAVVLSTHGFVTERRDQQLEWMFLERSVPQLPERATLLSAVEVGGRNLDAFPEFLLSRTGRAYELVDVRRAARGEIAWPAPGDGLLYYQGMFCYFAFADEPPPDPMTPPCRAVHERYVAEPLLVEDLNTEGYSLLRYAGDGRGPFRIGFFRLSRGRELKVPINADERG